MNPFTYIKFKEDMLEAVQKFIIDTDYFVKKIDESSVILSNNKKEILFYLEATSLFCDIYDKTTNKKISIYEWGDFDIFLSYKKTEM